MYAKALTIFAVLEALVIGAVVATWDRLTDQYLHGYGYDIGSHDASIFYLVVGTAVSAVAGYAYHYQENRY